MADHKKRVELLEDDDFKFLSGDHDVSNLQNDYVYTYTERHCTQEGWKPNSHGNGYTSQNLHSYLRTMPVKSEEIEGSNLDTKNEMESQILDLNVNCEPHYETHAPGYPTRSVIKEVLDIQEESGIKEEYLIPDSNTNGGLSASRVPDYMLESRSDLKEEIEENQSESYGPLYASHVDDPSPNIKEYEPGGYRSLYGSCESPPDVTYKPELESTELQSDLGIIRPSSQNIQPLPQTFNMTASHNAHFFQEPRRNLGLAALLCMPNVSQNMSDLAVALNRRNQTDGTSQLQSNMFNTLNTTPGNSICATEPRAINVSPLLKPNISNRESNTAPNTTVRAISRPNVTYDIPQLKTHNISRVPDTAPATTNNCVTDPIPNQNHGSPQIKPNMANRGANTEPNTIVRAMESLSLAHGDSQLKSNTSNTSSHTIHNTMPCLTYTAQNTSSNTTRNTEMRPNLAIGPSQIQSNMSKRVPNTASTVCATSPKPKHTQYRYRQPTVEVTELIANLNHGPQFKLNMSNDPTNIVRADLRHHLSHTLPQSESNMSNKEPNTGPNTVRVSRPNSAHGSSHPNMNPLQATSQVARTSRIVENHEDQSRASNEDSQSKKNKNFFDWEKQLRGSISTPNDSVKRNDIAIKATTKEKTTNPPVKPITIGRRITLRYICNFCSCIYRHAPTCERHMTRQHHVKADRLWKQICTYIQCRYCLGLIVRQSYTSHVRTHNKLYYNYYKSIKQ